MIPKLLIMVVLLLAQTGHIHTASAASTRVTEKAQAKKTYYHSRGYISAIWKNARRTVYHPDKRKADQWWRALHYLEHRMARSYRIIHPAPKHPRISKWLVSAFTCIHGYEGAWNANTGNGYYGGLQMDSNFQATYGPDFMAKWGSADKWPPWAQIQAAVRAYNSGRGFYPWPNTAAMCGLI